MNFFHQLWQLPFKGFESGWNAIGDFLYNGIFNFVHKQSWRILWPALGETIYMTVMSTLIAYILGLFLGIVLVTTRKGGIKPMPTFNAVLGAVVNFLRSIPFLILLAMLLPVTKAVVGKMMGTVAIVFPLIISAFPYVARMVEASFNEVDPGIIEASKAMGSTTMQIIRKVLLPEALPSLINGFSICMTTILAYTAMASAAAGGGLGSVAITYGLNQRRFDIMYAASIMLVVLVQIITVTGSILTRKKDHRLR